MEGVHDLLLPVWREACRHIHITESASAIAALLFGRVSIGQLLIRRVDVARSGLLLMAAEVAQDFTTFHESLLEALLEPFSVALENDGRVREMAAFREAAEADRRSLLSRLGRQALGVQTGGLATAAAAPPSNSRSTRTPCALGCASWELTGNDFGPEKPRTA